MGAEFSVPGFGWTQSASVQIEEVATLDSESISIGVAIKALLLKKPELASEFPDEKIDELDKSFIERDEVFRCSF